MFIFFIDSDFEAAYPNAVIKAVGRIYSTPQRPWS